MEHFVLQMTLRGGLENPSFLQKTLALSFYGSNSFWFGPNHFGQVQTIKISPEKSNMNLTKMIWTQPKRFGHDQNNWYSSKIIWMVQNHYGSIEGQGISVLLKKAIS